MLERTLRDVRYAVRALLRTPAYTVTAVLTLGLGIGATAAIFSFVNGLLLRPLPYPAPDGLVMVWQDHRAIGGPPDEWFTPPDFVDLREQSRSFTAISGLGQAGLTFEHSDGAERVPGAVVSPEFFETVGIQPLMGRGFLADETLDSRVLVLTHGFWLRAFGGDPAVVGSTVTFSGVPFTIVGVMPPHFVTPYFAEAEFLRANVWRADGPCGRLCYSLRVLARTRDGVTVDQVGAEASQIAARIAVEAPDKEGVDFRVVTLHAELTEAVRRPVFALLGAVGFLLLIACVNVANLTIARNAQRERELALRSALGARRTGILWQLMTESLLVALAGGVLGLLVTYWGVEALLALVPSDVPLIDRIGVDGRVLGFAALAALGSGLLFGGLPALQAARPNVNDALKEGSGASTGRARLRARAALVVFEIAVALVLLVGAGLLMKSFFRLIDVDMGFRAENVLLGDLVITSNLAATAQEASTLVESLVERLAVHPNVAAASAVSMAPLAGAGTDVDFYIEGQPLPTRAQDTNVAWYRAATPDYRSALGIQLAAGRWFEAGDRAEAPNVVVISETMARRFWPAEDPIGRRIRLGGPEEAFWTIVGVSRDVRHFSVEESPRIELFLPLAQFPQRGVTVALRTHGDPVQLAGFLRGEVGAVDPALPVASIRTLEQQLGAALAVPRLVMTLFAAFAGVALLLASIGIYGVMASAVGARRREIGVRMALGAHPQAIRELFLGRAILLAVCGIAIGGVAAAALARTLEAILFEVRVTDPSSFLLVALLLGSVALVASYLPARRAMRMDPVKALRA